MKKVLFLMAAVVAVMFAACKGGGASAKDAVDAAMKALVAQDYKAYAGFSYVDESMNKEAADNAITLAANAAEKLYKENPVVSYEILGEEAQGEDKAVVEVKIKQKDGKENTTKMNMVKNKAGEWKIKGDDKAQETTPAKEGAEEKADAADLDQAAKDAAAEIEKAADEAVKAIDEAAKK